MKKFILVILLSLFLTGCGAFSPYWRTGYADGPNAIDGVLVRPYVWSASFDKVKYVAVAEELDLLKKRSAKHLPVHTFIFLVGRENTFSTRVPNEVESLMSASALGVQSGDLVESLTREVKDVLLSFDGQLHIGLRIVCKFYDEECIQREFRSYYCKGGLMLIDGVRREDKPCGEAGRDAEIFASIIGRMDELYGSVDNYLKIHDAPWDAQCLTETFDCGADKGMAVEWDKYDEFLERFPNYYDAQFAAFTYEWEQMHTDLDRYEHERQWAKYLSLNMFSTELVPYSKEQFIQDWRDGNLTATDTTHIQ